MNGNVPDMETVRAAYWYKRHVSGYESTADTEFAKFIANIKADAWDEGWRDSTGYTHRIAKWARRQHAGHGLTEPEQPENPYR